MKNKKNSRGKTMVSQGAVYTRYTLAMLIRLEKKKVLTYTDLRFEQVWCGDVWRTHTFPRLTPVKAIAEKLRCTEPPLRKALLAGKNSFQQWDITHA